MGDSMSHYNSYKRLMIFFGSRKEFIAEIEMDEK